MAPELPEAEYEQLEKASTENGAPAHAGLGPDPDVGMPSPPILTEIVRKNVKNAIAKSFTKPHLEKSIATAPKILNDRPRRLIRSSIFRS